MTPGLRLEGRAFAVTGSSRGIGAAVADDLAARGADVVLNGRDPEVLQARVAELAERSRGRVVGVAGSAHEPDVAQALLERAGVTEKDLARGGIPDIKQRLGNVALLAGELGCGVMTLVDIVSELEKPGRDPRDDAALAIITGTL